MEGGEKSSQAARGVAGGHESKVGQMGRNPLERKIIRKPGGAAQAAGHESKVSSGQLGRNPLEGVIMDPVEQCSARELPAEKSSDHQTWWSSTGSRPREQGEQRPAGGNPLERPGREIISSGQGSSCRDGLEVETDD